MKWKNMPLFHKIAMIVSLLAVAVWVVYEVKPDLFPIDLTCPAIAVFTACEAVFYWKRRPWGYLLIAAAVISTACFFLELML
jgi:glucose-6-phosphate-specific signal transduction histidine kinase